MPPNATGFGDADWLEFGFGALLLVSAFVWNPACRRKFTELASRTRAAILFLFALPILLRLLLLPHHPVPVPSVYDEFSHLLVADTLLHFRLANPPHALARFFETFFVLQRPTYSSIYPLGQGLLLAFGRVVSGVPWTGVLLATGSFCAACYWMLRAYVSPPWALLGGLLAAIQFGPLSLWMNSYWGGSLAAAAGCLIFGSAPRLLAAWRMGARARARDGALLGLGFGVHLLTRPFESIFLTASLLLYTAMFAADWRRGTGRRRTLAITFAACAPALLLLLLQNKQVTGKWSTLPEELSRLQYGVPTTLTIQQPATPTVPLTPQQTLEYKAQLLMHGPGRDSIQRFLLRLEYRVREYRFFFAAPLYLALFAFLFTLRNKVRLWAACSLAIFGLGTNLFPYFMAHYLAAVTCLFALISVEGLRKIHGLRIRERMIGPDIVRIILLLCAARFVLWYGIHFFEGHELAQPDVSMRLLQYETWDTINHPGTRQIANRRAEVAAQLARIPGKLLVLVHYSARHIFQDEWVWNAADIDHARVIFARDLGEEQNHPLIHYFAERKVIRLEPDLEPAVLTPEALEGR